MPFPLQDTKGRQATGDMMPLSPLGARLTARQTELILASFHDFLDLGAQAIEPPYLRRGERQTIGGVGLGAVSDAQDFQASGPPAGRCPIRVPPIRSERLTIEPAVLLQAADNAPAIVTTTPEQGLGGLPGITEDILGATAPMIARIAEEV
jgi:hypothetical protein